MNATNGRKSHEAYGGRLSSLAVGVVLLSSVLALRLWQLQIVGGAEYAKDAEDNRLDYEVIKSPRGIIYGRDENVVLADNRAACDLALTPALLRDVDQVAKEWESAARILGGGKTLLCRIDDTLARNEPIDAMVDVSDLNESDRGKVQSLLNALVGVRSMCDQLAQLVGVDSDTQFVRILSAVRRKVPFEQIIVKEDISKTERMRVEEYAFALQGVYTIARPQRRYYYGASAGQVLGWFNEISPEELAVRKPRYTWGDIIGRDGIEKWYEDQLKGTDGAMIVSRYNGSVPQLRTDARGNPYIEVDSKGRALQVEQRDEAVPGKPIFTTLDIGLQQECERILSEDLLAEDIVDVPAEGAIVVLNADNGEVLAMASIPNYAPNIFATKTPDQKRLTNELLRDPKKPMINRAFQIHYYPGSVFKVLLAIAGLEEKVIDEHTTFSCGGSFSLGGGNTWRCWKHSGHGGVNVVDALAFSCDVFFYNVGRQLGPDRIEKWGAKLGVGVKTGIDLPREVPGYIPNPAKKKAMAKALKLKNPDDYNWYPGETINMSIGQGTVDTTILQNAVLMAAVINGGKRVRPFVNMATGPEVSQPLISENTLRIVHDGMFKCVDRKQPPSGTGKLARVEGLEILGKTGTAQVVNMAQLKGRKERQVPYDLRDHALFVSGVTNMQPRIAVSVVVEHGLHGSSTAAPVARKVFEYFYMNKRREGAVGETPAPVAVALNDGSNE